MIKKNYKDTLDMPVTDFPMRGNLSQKENEIEGHWDSIGLYSQVLNQNKNNLSFVFHDGPPYANGNIHIGHALNKILKDFIIRFKTMQGYYSPYVPGWDCHGLPIETAVLKKFPKSKLTSPQVFKEESKNIALGFMEKQKKMFQRLGILGQWDKPYLTLDNSFVADEIRIFGKMIANNLIFKKLKPVYWSPYLESVLAESEIEHKNKESFSIFFLFPVLTQGLFQNAQLIIWTTTPWTLPANVAVCVNPEKDYQLIQVKNNRYIVGASVLENLKKKFNWEQVKIIKQFKGDTIKGLEYENKLFEHKGKVVLDTFVSDKEGTGLVHIAPGHGLDDFLLSEKYNLDILLAVNKKGFMNENAQKYQNIFYDEANISIIDDLKNNNLLMLSEKITHSYPHDERTRRPVIFLAIPQWFLNIDKIKDQLLSEIKNVEWFPKWGEIKMFNMIKDRKEWVISRQRVWGTPIPIFYTENNEPILDHLVIEHVADLFEKHGKNIWFEWDASQLLPPNYRHYKSPNNIFTKEKDIIDVWFDSGTSYSVFKKMFPNLDSADVYLEGADQYRGWFNSSLITSIATFQKAPYKKVITHGFVLDGSGQKMSKSLNNVVDPLQIIKQKGADILRLWVASVNYNIDVRLDKAILEQIEEKYKKIRNTFRFMLGNLNNFDPSQEKYIPFSERTLFHQLFFLEFQNIFSQVIKFYEDYNFEKIMSLLYPFIVNKMSAFYLDYGKDILYIEKPNNKEKNIIQSNIYDILISCLKILTPIIPHTTSEIYQYLNSMEKKADIYLEHIPSQEEIQKQMMDFQFQQQNFSQIENDYKLFFVLREKALKQLEEARRDKTINKSLQAKIILKLPREYIQMLENLEIKSKLHQLFIVSKMEIISDTNLDMEIVQISGHSCPRCWNVIENKNPDDLCHRCENFFKK
ncbi:isoleucine--tRNA ligase ['Camptotheca acuminata' phytoplasma]|uniref:isoleucine--tRNA ligase n=1 Tax='Camptotheca acuminata' phytoplasma TaxID=3239192 RepID=UPI00351A2920